MSAEFLFVPTLSAGSTGKARLLQQADAKRHAAIVAHRRKVRLQSKSQAISPQPYDLSNSTTPVAPAQPHVTPDINPTANKSLVPGLSGSQQNGGFPLISKSNFELSSLLPSRDVNPDAAEDGDSETCANLQPSRLVVSDHLDYEANTESIAARTVNGGIREHQDLSVVIRSTATSKPTYPLSHGYSDSFCRAIEYFTRVLVPNNTPVYAIFEVSNVNCLYFLEVVQSSRSQYVIHSVLALLHLVVGNVVPQTSSAQYALKHTVTALSLLRKVISEGGIHSDDAAIVSAVCLVCFSRAQGDYAAYNVHRNRLALMIKSRGGLDNTGSHGFLKALVLQFAPPACIPLSLCFNRFSGWAQHATVDPNDPFFHDSRCFLPDTGPGPPINAELAAGYEGLPVGFKNLIREGTLSLKTIQLLRRIASAVGQQSHGGQHYGDSWRVARYSDFWECCPSIARVGPDLEKYLCLALLLYTANEVAPERAYNKGMALYSGPRAVLAAEIGLMNLVQLTPTQRQCWMWIWWVVIDSSIEANKVNETGALLMSQFWATFPEVHGWDGLRPSLRLFFWGGKLEASVSQLMNASPLPDAAALSTTTSNLTTAVDAV